MDIKAKAREIVGKRPDVWTVLERRDYEVIEAALREAYDVGVRHGEDMGYRAGLERAAEIADPGPRKIMNVPKLGDPDIVHHTYFEARLDLMKAIRAEMEKD